MFRRFGIEFFEEFQHLIQTPRADALEEAALFNTAHGNDVLPGKMFLLENLQEVMSGTVFFQMEVYQNVQLIFKRHFQGPVASRG